jgi:hypothetical protein
VLEEFSGWFNGKTSPVHLFWHSLDLALSRFSGRPGVPMEADPVTQEAYSQEVISFGFWAGDTTSFESTWCPTPSQMEQLHAGAAAAFGRTAESA